MPFRPEVRWSVIRSEPHVLFQEVLLQLAQQGVRIPHVGFLHEGQVAHVIECSPPYGFEFLPGKNTAPHLDDVVEWSQH